MFKNLNVEDTINIFKTKYGILTSLALCFLEERNLFWNQQGEARCLNGILCRSPARRSWPQPPAACQWQSRAGLLPSGRQWWKQMVATVSRTHENETAQEEGSHRIAWFLAPACSPQGSVETDWKGTPGSRDQPPRTTSCVGWASFTWREKEFDKKEPPHFSSYTSVLSIRGPLSVQSILCSHLIVGHITDVYDTEVITAPKLQKREAVIWTELCFNVKVRVLLERYMLFSKNTFHHVSLWPNVITFWVVFLNAHILYMIWIFLVVL